MLLLGLGLVMVQSTASVVDLTAGLSPYSDFSKQLLGAAVGLPLMWVAARSSPRLFRAFAYPLLAVSVVGLSLTLIRGVGVSQNGAARWIDLGGQQIQPSEIAKLALVVWGADLLARKEKLGQLADWRHMLVPLMPGAGVLCLLVMSGDDLGTTFILLVIFLALLWVIGTPGRVRQANLRGQIRSNRIGHDTQRWPLDPPVAGQIVQHCLGRVDWDGKSYSRTLVRAVRGDHRVDADHLAVRVQQRAAGVARIDGRVGLDSILDGRAFRGSNRADGADDAAGHRAVEAEGIADGVDLLAHGQISLTSALQLALACLAASASAAAAAGVRVAPFTKIKVAKMPADNAAINRDMAMCPS